MIRRHNFQNISWFYDLNNRGLLDLNPPYQRRSVWPRRFKEYFIDTLLLSYPAPAIFLFEDIRPDGRSLYHVVDGKQRLNSIFEFIENSFPVSDISEATAYQGKYFNDLDDPTKTRFFGYQFLVEYVPSTESAILNSIFDRINRNVSKLTPQELRHAKFEGEFIKCCEYSAEWMTNKLPKNVPRMSEQAVKQMKDVEFSAILLLLLEEGAKGYSQYELDIAFAERDEIWENKKMVIPLFKASICYLADFFNTISELDFSTTRLRNQTDFYSLFGAVSELIKTSMLPDISIAHAHLSRFILNLENEEIRQKYPDLHDYYQAARSASNDKGPREARIGIIKKVILGS